MSGWKASVLSLAGRATLIQAVTSTIPVYTMQTVDFPKNICDKINRLNRNFLWGQKGERNKIHLAKWRKVCKPKKHGVLGLRTSVENNRANSTKLGWRIIKEQDPIWVNVLKDKYKIPHNP